MAQGIETSIPFIDAEQHMYDTTHMKVEDNVGTLNELYPDTELCYFNFDVDGGVISKRGDETIELFGDDNNGVIEDGELKLAGLGSSSARLLSLSLPTVNELSAKISMKNTGISFTDTRELWRAENTADDSRIRFYAQWQGSNIYRILVQVNDESNTVKTTTLLGTIDITGSIDPHVTFSFKKGESLYLYFNGAYHSTIDSSLWNLNFSQIDVYWGDSEGDNNTIVDFEYTQIINADYYYSEGEIDTGEIYSYDQTYQEMIAVAPVLMDKFFGFAPVYDYIDNGEIRHRIMVNSSYYFYNTTDEQWQAVTNTETDYNTMDEINDHAEELELPSGTGAYIQFTTLILSTDGFSAPAIFMLVIDYRFFFDFGAATAACIVYGKVEDGFGEPVEGAIIRFIYPKKTYNGDTLCSVSVQAETGSNGKWDVSLIETESIDVTIKAYIEYESIDKDGDAETILEEYTGITIFNTTTKTWKETLEDSGVI